MKYQCENCKWYVFSELGTICINDKLLKIADELYSSPHSYHDHHNTVWTGWARQISGAEEESLEVRAKLCGPLGKYYEPKS